MEKLMAQTMTQAVLCHDVIRLLWNDGSKAETIPDIEFPIESKALASYVKNHRIDTQWLNVLDVIHILWPPFATSKSADKIDWDDAEARGKEYIRDILDKNPPRFVVREYLDTIKAVDIESRAISQVHERDLVANLVVYDVNFPDGSKGMVIVENGRGEEFLVL